MDAIYTTVATASGDGRNGHTETEDGLLAVDVRIPKEMGGQGGATNPEQLFAAGYAACFLSAVKVVARAEKADVDGAQVSATVAIGRRPAGGMGLAVELDIHAPNLDDDSTLALANKAHELCPYSNAISGNVDVKLTVV
jgi:osmotically inducible protein OsmC